MLVQKVQSAGNEVLDGINNFKYSMQYLPPV